MRKLKIRFQFWLVCTFIRAKAKFSLAEKARLNQKPNPILAKSNQNVYTFRPAKS